MRTTNRSLPRRSWAVILIIGFFGQVAWTIENMYLNVFLYNTISTDTTFIAAMVAASAIVATLTTFAIGALSDHIQKRKIFMTAGYILWGIATMSFGWIRLESVGSGFFGLSGAAIAAVLVIVVDCVMTFFGSSANDAAFNAWVTDITVPENRGRVQSVLSALPLLSMLVVFGALDPLTQSGNWPLFFLIVGASTMLAGVLGIFLIRETKPTRPKESDGYLKTVLHGFRKRTISDNLSLYIALLAMLLYAAATQIYMPYLIIYIQHYLGIQDYALILGVVLITAGVISVLSGRWIDRVGKKPVAHVALVVESVGLMGMYLAREPWQIMLAGSLMLGGSMMLLSCLNGMIADEIPVGMAGRFQGVRMIAAVMLPMIIGPFVGNALIQSSGVTYVELGQSKLVPTPSIFIGALVLLLTVLVPLLLMQKGGRRGK